MCSMKCLVLCLADLKMVNSFDTWWHGMLIYGVLVSGDHYPHAQASRVM